MPKDAYVPANVINATLNPATSPEAGPAVTTTAAPPTSGRALRQLFINYLTLRQLAPRTVQSYTEWIIQLSRFHDRSPDLLGNEEIKAWLLHLIAKPYSASSLNLAINAVRSY